MFKRICGFNYNLFFSLRRCGVWKNLQGLYLSSRIAIKSLQMPSSVNFGWNYTRVIFLKCLNTPFEECYVSKCRLNIYYRSILWHMLYFIIFAILSFPHTLRLCMISDYSSFFSPFLYLLNGFLYCDGIA